MRCTFTFLFLLCGVISSKAFASALVESVQVPHGWEKDSVEPKPNELVALQIGLKQQNLSKMIDSLHAVSDPDSKAYGKYFEHHQVLDLLKPQAEHEQKVISWLQSDKGVINVSSDGHWVDFVATVETVNRLLHADFTNYVNLDGFKKLRTTHYSVPDMIANAVDLIVPTTYFGRAAKPIHSRGSRPLLQSRSTALNYHQPCSEIFSPTCIKRAYNVGSYAPNPKSGSRVGFASFVHNPVRIKDLFKFEKIFNITKQGLHIEEIHRGKNEPSGDFTESNLDSQTITGVAAGLPVTAYFTGGLAPFKPDPREPQPSDNTNEPFLPYVKYLLNQPNGKVPQVLSHSVSDDEQTVPYKYASRVCNTMAALGLRGITLLFSSGDHGVGAACVSNGKNKHREYTPEFPASCPYVTAVGGTQNPKHSNRDELAWFGSGGGFSNYFSRPAYQGSTVRRYFEKHVSKRTQKYIAQFYNRTGRGYPDISARSFGSGYPDVTNGQKGISGGTSASSPAWAGIVALLNDARLRNGQPALGFLNPFLYKAGFKALDDVKLGGSGGCYGTQGVFPGYKKIPFASWNATEGWDPATGLGTPDFQKLRKMILNLHKP